MNTVQQLINAQLGNYVFSRYDASLKRLHCDKSHDFKSFNIATETSVPQSDDPTDGPPVFACKFAPENSGYAHLLALANEDGKICIQNTHSPPYERFITNAHHNAIFDLAWMPGHMKLVTVSGDHTARLFDVTPTSLIAERIFHGHFRSVKTVACRRDDPAVFATGSRDGAIFVWDSRANPTQNYIQKPDRIISNPHSVNCTPTRFKFRKRLGANFIHVPGTESVTGLAFQDDVTLISCGAGDGHIKIWDLRYYSHRRNPSPKYTIPYSGTMSHKGFSNLIVDKSGVKLYASCMDNTIYCYNVATYQPEPIMTYQGHQQSTFYVKSCLSTDGNYLVSGSGDNHCYIWSTVRGTPIVRLEGHTHEVTCVAWCNTRNVELVTCSDDLRHKIWRISAQDAEFERNHCGLAFSEVKTPSANAARKRKNQDQTPQSSGKKQTLVCERCQMRTPGAHDSPRNCENCLFGANRRSVKRSAATALASPDVKRQHSARSCLFSGEQQDAGVLATILEENSPGNSPEVSLTANLPNFVVDGQAPHLRNYSPQKKKDKDWLTKIRIEQSLRTHMEELSSPAAPTSPKLVKFSPKYQQSGGSTGKKCSKKLTMTTGGNDVNSSVKSPLLKYFIASSNGNNK